jgi:hypothetical protein
MRKIILFFTVLFLIAGAVGFWYWQRNDYSKDILKLEILSQEQVQAGEEVEYTVRLKNNGEIRLEDAELIFQAPKQSILEDYSDNRVTRKIEDIYPGEERTYSFKARLFGKEGDTLEAKAWLDYRPKNLKARYESQTSFVSKIKFVPLTFEFDLPSKAEDGEGLDFSLNYFSNINYLLKDLRIKITYPQGFQFESSKPQALDETEWSLPSLYQASGGRIEIKGKLEGQEGEEKVFKAQLGMIRNGEFWVLKEASQAVEIVEPSLYVSTLINNSQDYKAEAGDFLHYEIFFRNIGKRPIEKKFMIASLEGDFFDLSTLKSARGEFGKGDNTILWDWKTVPQLRFLDAGQEGKVEFWIKLKNDVDIKVKNPLLRVKVNLAGVEKTFETKINSKIELTQKAYFNQEFFPTEGPLPPRVGESTKYVILWQLSNTWNDLRNVKVKAVLGENVSPTGKLFPEDAKFTYDPDSREVIWNVGELKAWESFENSSTSTLAFQIALTPSKSQKGTSPILVEQAEVVAEDSFTSEIITQEASAVNTALPDDETVSSQQGIVK